MSTAYKRTALTGGTAAALDGIDGDNLLDGDFAFVMTSAAVYFYELDDDSGAAESSPDIIAPDDNPGNKRWILQNVSGVNLAESTNSFTIKGGTSSEKTLTVDETKSMSHKMDKASNLSDVASAATSFANIKQAATTSATGVVVYSGNTKAIAGTDTASAMTPDDVKYVLDRRIQQFYGVAWDESADTYTRTGSTAGQATGVTLADAFLPVQRRMRRCVLKDDGTVAYYLSATNSTKKEDGSTASDLTGTDGQVMVEVPKFWYRHTYVGTTHTWEVSAVPLAGFSVHPAFLSGSTEYDFIYYGAYEACLYDVSASLYNGQCYLPAGQSTVFDETGGVYTITVATRAGWATNLKVGQKLVVSGTTTNDGTFTVATIVDGTAITVTEAVTDQTSSTAVIQAETDVTATTGDKLSSVSGVLPITGGSANGTRAHFRVWAANRGAGWSQALWDVHSAIQLLYLTEYADWYSQDVLGYGIAAVGDWLAYNDYNPIAKTGNSNSIGNATGCTATSAITTGAGAKDVYLSYRGIENFYGHIWKWVDGINTNNNRSYVCNVVANLADDTSVNYTDIGVDNINDNGYQGTLLDIDRGFLPKSLTGGDADSKITDYYYQSTGWRVANSGGNATDGAIAGVAALYLYNASGYVNRKIGGRVVFRK